MSKLRNISITALVVACSISAAAQAAEPRAQQPASAQQPTSAAPQGRLDATHQMQLDLDQMDSLVNNMAAQTSFIRDTNMSILLNTNVRLWSILIRDLRLQVDAQQKQAADKLNSPQKH